MEILKRSKREQGQPTMMMGMIAMSYESNQDEEEEIYRLGGVKVGLGGQLLQSM